jgi:hypothetical protein
MDRFPIGGIQRRFIDIWRVINMVSTIIINVVESMGRDSRICIVYLWRDLGFFGDREVLVEKEGEEVEAVHCF